MELRRALSDLLRGSGYEVIGLDNGTRALELATREPFDLAIIDWNLPGISGLDLIRSLRSRARELPILIVTARDALTDKVTGLDSGADDYLVKPFRMPELEARVRALLRRTRPHSASPIQVGRLMLIPGEPRVHIGSLPVDLPANEFVLLEMLAAHLGRAVSKEAIASRLARGGEPPSDTAIEICVHRLRRRLSPIDLKIRTMRGFGYVLENPPRPKQCDLIDQ